MEFRAIENVLNGILAGVDAENQQLLETVEALPLVSEAATHVKNGDFERFFYELLYPLERFVDGLLEREFPHSSEAQFIFKQSQFLEHHLERIFSTLEGYGCCADKARTVVAHLLAFFTTGKRISFDYSQKFTYHLPEKVLKTHDEIYAFFAALRRLYYGHPDAYVQELANIHAQAAEANDSKKESDSGPVAS
jgi:hypothetical protein